VWDEYPAAAAFGLTAWGYNRMAYTFGYSGYANPYYDYAAPAETVVYDYSQPLVSYDTAYAAPAVPQSTVVVAPQSTPAAPSTVVVAPQSTTPADAAAAPPSLPPGVTQEGLDAFDQARNAFYRGEYPQAMTLVNTALKSMPKDAATHEFRALVQFALGKYQEAASTLYAVLAVGPGWDWTTLSSMYPDIDTYTAQLRQLEKFATDHPDSSPAHFLLAYHYLTMGHKDSAKRECAKVVELTPGNAVASQLLAMLGGSAAAPASPQGSASGSKKEGAPPPTDSAVVGNWSASSRNSKFDMQLANDGKFTWAFSQNGKRQEVKGVYALEGNTLAMEPDSGSTMLADISLTGKDTLQFQMIGAPAGDPGLTFKR
jgi:tetratricopeptide (TPR) repeat protein